MCQTSVIFSVMYDMCLLWRVIYAEFGFIYKSGFVSHIDTKWVACRLRRVIMTEFRPHGAGGGRGEGSGLFGTNIIQMGNGIKYVRLVPQLNFIGEKLRISNYMTHDP